jgi:phage N-6-adenine-methyltransferase
MRVMDDVLFSSASNEWGTPQSLFDALDREFHFTLDPASTHENAKCKKHYTIEENGLAQSWDSEIVFLNPPYGRDIWRWIKKASESYAVVVCLIPARTDTSYWQKYVFPIADEVRFLPGRVKFQGGKYSAPFPSAVVVFRPVIDRKFFMAVPVITHQALK